MNEVIYAVIAGASALVGGAALVVAALKVRTATTNGTTNGTAAPAVRYVRGISDPSGRVYRVRGPAKIEGFLSLEDPSGEGAPETFMAEDQVQDVYGYDPTAERLAKLLAAQATTAMKLQMSPSETEWDPTKPFRPSRRDGSEDEDDSPPLRLARSTRQTETIAAYERALANVERWATVLDNEPASVGAVARELHGLVKTALRSEDDDISDGEPGNVEHASVTGRG